MRGIRCRDEPNSAYANECTDGQTVVPIIDSVECREYSAFLCGFGILSVMASAQFRSALCLKS